MSTTTTRQLREPFVETAGIGLTEAALPYLKQAIDTASYTENNSLLHKLH